MESQNRVERSKIFLLLGLAGIGLSLFVSVIAFASPLACTFLSGLQMIFAIPAFLAGIVLIGISIFTKRRRHD
jgi:hypothetical protein